MQDQGTPVADRQESVQLYDVPEVMRMLRLSRSAVYEELRAGRLRSVHRGRSRRIPVAAVAEYVALLEREADQDVIGGRS
jgi:excisionase family DNA binding protein